jgi:hypothetical protein
VFVGTDIDGGIRDFRVRLFSDESGSPGSTPFFEQSVTASVVDTGVIGLHPNHNSMPIFQYTSLVDPVHLIAGTKYWISVLNENSVYPKQWVWQASSFDTDNYVALRNSDGPSGLIRYSFDF